MTAGPVELWHVMSGVERRLGRADLGAPDPWVTLLDQNFDAVALANPISAANANAALGGTAGGTGTFDAFAIVASGGGRAWRWRSPAGTYGNGAGNGCATFRSAETAIAAHVAAHGLILSAAIEYDITFPANMDWSLGGKLPGLGGTATAANPPTGGAGPTPDGWSGRSMWRGPASGTYFGRRALDPNEWVGYRYCVGQAYPGENIWSSRSFIAGQTHHVRTEYDMNTVAGGVGNPDGGHRMYFDGEQVVDDTDVVWRSRADLGINRHLWHFFRGGDTATWEGSVTNDIIVDNLLIQAAAS